jgi:predicted RNase H-like nuclease
VSRLGVWCAKFAKWTIWITPEKQNRVVEIHPELSFWALNGRIPINENKDTLEGIRKREALLRKFFRDFTIQKAIAALNLSNGPSPKPDDINDALAAAWTAYWRAFGCAGVIPMSPQRDAKGLRMEMHY